ncbi:MAG: (2Fe-2S)-binding protein [Pseudomonadota bacterium]|nr:(2Fe-2S)-binding protein [Pseudomonadota bacterium]
MIVCICKAVSDRHIRAAVKGGACCMRDLTRDLGIGTCCGKCVPAAKASLFASLEAGGDCAVAAYFSPSTAEFAV